jgi:hypothetical protein
MARIKATSDGFVNGGAATITTSDSTEYDPPLRGICVTVAGTVQVVHTDGSTAPIQCAAGAFIPVANIKKVMSTGTTATGIVCWKG